MKILDLKKKKCRSVKKSQLKKLEKEKKLLINKMKEPKSIIDYVNKCFTGKK